MLLRCALKKQWQKCPKSYNFCHNGSMLKSVAVIVVPNFSIFEFATACEVFGIDRSDRGGNVPAFDFRVCTPEPGRRPAQIRPVHERPPGAWRPPRMRTW